jgi:hypothetical protein
MLHSLTKQKYESTTYLNKPSKKNKRENNSRTGCIFGSLVVGEATDTTGLDEDQLLLLAGSLISSWPNFCYVQVKTNKYKIQAGFHILNSAVLHTNYSIF